MTYEIHFFKSNIYLYFGINPTFLFFIHTHELLLFETCVFHATYLITFKDYIVFSLFLKVYTFFLHNSNPPLHLDIDSIRLDPSIKRSINGTCPITIFPLAFQILFQIQRSRNGSLFCFLPPT